MESFLLKDIILFSIFLSITEDNAEKDLYLAYLKELCLRSCGRYMETSQREQSTTPCIKVSYQAPKPQHFAVIEDTFFNLRFKQRQQWGGMISVDQCDGDSE